MSANLTTELVENHRQFLGFLERRLGNRGENLREEGSAVAWFYRMLRNAIIDHYRRTGTRNRAYESVKNREAMCRNWTRNYCA